jgi:hypothetical protein
MSDPTPSRYRWTWKGVTFDFYRLCRILGINGGPQEHALKKIIAPGSPSSQSLETLTRRLMRCVDGRR